MKALQWQDDDLTAFWANKVPLPISLEPQPQYDGSNARMHEQTWTKHIIKESFPDYCRESDPRYLSCHPAVIMRCHQDANVLEGLALTIAWGGMTRTKGRIYTQSNQILEETLLQCTSSIREQERIEPAWNILTGNLGWSDVITSKYLHFVARALGYEHNPPVPIDNLVIHNRVWPAFKTLIKTVRRADDPSFPKSWLDGATWEAYNRYMTAINCWATRKGWTTPQLEPTIFVEYYPE